MSSEVCYADLMEGHSEIRTAPVAERRWHAEPHDLRAGVGLIRSGNLRRWELVRSTVSADERAWWATDDPRPFLSATFSEFRSVGRLALAGLRAGA